MKPCDLTEDNWDINAAVVELGDGEAEIRIFASATAIQFSSYTALGIRIEMPIAVWREILSYVAKFDKKDKSFNDNHQTGFYTKTEGYEVLIHNAVGSFDKNNKIVYKKTPMKIAILHDSNNQERIWEVSLRMSIFEKIVKWYNTDI